MAVKWLVLALVLLIIAGAIALSIWNGVGQANRQVIDVMHTQQYAAGETAVHEFRLTSEAGD